MSTFSELKVKVSRDLRDTDLKVFDTTVVGDLINAGIAEIGRIAPKRFKENITPVVDTLSYAVQSATFAPYD